MAVPALAASLPTSGETSDGLSTTVFPATLEDQRLPMSLPTRPYREEKVHA